MDLVTEIDFCDPSIKGKLPIVLYSSISQKPNGDLIYLINIEPLNNAKVMFIEIFSSKNFYKKGKIESFNSSLNIFSFRCELEQRYFIKINTEEYKIYNNIDIDDDIVLNKVDDQKLNLLFFGFYEFEKSIFEINFTNNIEKKKQKKSEENSNNIKLDINYKKQNIDIMSFMNGFNVKSEDINSEKNTSSEDINSLNSDIDIDIDTI